MKISGHMDMCGPDLIEGWLYSSEWDGETINLQVYIDGQLIGECSADRFREDLQEAGFGDGRCGFSFEVPSHVEGIDFAATKLRLMDSPVYLLPSDDTVIAPSRGGAGGLGALADDTGGPDSAAAGKFAPSSAGKRRF